MSTCLPISPFASLSALNDGKADTAWTVTQYLHSAEGRIAFDDTGGSGPLVIALPGMGELRRQYRYLRPYLVAAGFRLVTIDVRGQGESSVGWSDYSARAAGADVLAMLDHLGAGQAVVIGNSFAAGAAYWAADHAPERIRGTVLIGPILRDLPMSPLVKLALAVGMAGPWRYPFWMSYWNSLFPSRKPADHAQYAALLERNLREPGRYAALKTMVGLSKADTDAVIEGVRLPALVVMGSKDPDFPDAAAEASVLAARIGADSVVVEGAGHYPHVEMPERVGPEIARFLRQLS